MQTINLDKLPSQAKLELLNFYRFLLKKYAPSELSETDTKKISRWEKIAQRVHTDTSYPTGWSKQLKQDVRDFRENFSFRHDRI